MKSDRVANKLWFRLFLKIALLMVTFVMVLAVSNIGFLVHFFCIKEERELLRQIKVIDSLDFENSREVSSVLAEISEKHNFDAEIFTASGEIVYTTRGGQLMDYFSLKNSNFVMAHEKLKTIKSEEKEDGAVFERAVRPFDGQEILLARKELDNGNFAEVSIPKRLISDSAAVANEFIVIVSVICLALSVIWVIILSRNISKPISQMNEITKDMAKLNFERKLSVNRKDEIGQLAVSVNELSWALSQALDDLKKKNRQLELDIEAERNIDAMRRNFIANVSHELKTPISIISGYAEGLKLDVNPQSNEEYCNIIIDESRRMNGLVMSILDLSRYESGQIAAQKEKIDLLGLCDDMAKRILLNKPVVFENCVKTGTEIFADTIQTEQILKSFLENAAAHTPDGGKIAVSCKKNADELRISVYNSGSRIDEEIMPHIWQSFFRGDKSHKRESSRFGLGLSIVSAICKINGKKCGVYNTEDGVCFWFDADMPID